MFLCSLGGGGQVSLGRVSRVADITAVAGVPSGRRRGRGKGEAPWLHLSLRVWRPWPGQPDVSPKVFLRTIGGEGAPMGSGKIGSTVGAGGLRGVPYVSSVPYNKEMLIRV